MNKILFTTYPDQGHAFIIETDATTQVIQDLSDNDCNMRDPDEIIRSLMAQGFQVNTDIMHVTHVYDAVNGHCQKL